MDIIFRKGGSDLQHDVIDGWLDTDFLYLLQQIDGVSAVTITPVRLHLMVRAGHRLPRRECASFQEVADEYAIPLDAPPTIERVLGMIRMAGVEPRIRWASRSMETIRTMVARGMGYSVLNTRPDTEISVDGGQVARWPGGQYSSLRSAAE